MIDYTFPELDDTAQGNMFDPMKKDEFKKFYREHLAVPAAGFGMAAVLLVIYLTVMTWLAGQVHLMQFSIDRFGH
jgi:hypothetical protein